MVLKVLLNTQIIWVLFIKILKTTIQIRLYLIVFEDVISDMLSNKKLNPIVTELFIRGKTLNICLKWHLIILTLQPL